MADQTAENIMNVCLADANNSVVDNNAGVNNTGPVGQSAAPICLNTGNDINAGHPGIPDPS